MTIKLKKIGIVVFLLLTLFSFKRALACTPLAVPTINNYTVVGNNLILNSTLNNVWTCSGYYIQVELTVIVRTLPGQLLFSINQHR